VPGQHPDFANQSPYSQQHISAFSRALSAMDDDSFTPRPSAEAKQAELEMAEDAALSRVRLIQDGPDFWHRSSAATELGGQAPG
jgi:hypothetical protein